MRKKHSVWKDVLIAVVLLIFAFVMGLIGFNIGRDYPRNYLNPSEESEYSILRKRLALSDSTLTIYRNSNEVLRNLYMGQLEKLHIPQKVYFCEYVFDELTIDSAMVTGLWIGDGGWDEYGSRRVPRVLVTSECCFTIQQVKELARKKENERYKKLTIEHQKNIDGIGGNCK